MMPELVMAPVLASPCELENVLKWLELPERLGFVEALFQLALGAHVSDAVVAAVGIQAAAHWKVF